MRHARAVALVSVIGVGAGCAQLLGLDNTKPPLDASIDAASVCDGMPLCTGSGRQLCGQLVATGSDAGAPVRALVPTGAACSGSAASGPCGLAVTGGSIDQLATGSDLVPGTIDDCGRFAVDLDPALADVAVVFEGTGFARTARALIGRPATAGSDVVTALAVPQATDDDWGMQLAAGSATPVDTTTGFLVLYTTTGSAPLAGEAAASDGSSPFMNPAGTTPWGAYFTGAFDALDPTATHTSASGAAFVVPGTGATFSLEGFRTGRRCKQPGLRQVNGTLIFVVETDC